MIQLTKDLFCIEVPMDANDFGFGFSFGKNTIGYYNNKECDEFIEVELPHNKWQLIGEVTKDELTFDCEPYVGREWCEPFEDYSYYTNYNNSKLFYNDKKDSFRSLIESKSGKTFLNPSGEKPTKDLYSERLANLEGDFLGTYQYDLKQWQQGESNLLKKVVILKLNNPIN